MAKKDKQKRENIEQKKSKENTYEKEPLTKGEKIFHKILLIVGIVSVLLIIIFSIGTGGDKNILARKYNSITNENVFDMIKYDELNEMIESKETFQVLIINSKQHDANYYIYCVNEVVKQGIEESGREQVIYVLDPAYLDKDEQKLFKDIDKSLLENPSLVLFGYEEDYTIGEKSVDINSTDRYFIEDFGDNVWNLLVKYFNDCE